MGRVFCANHRDDEIDINEADETSFVETTKTDETENDFGNEARPLSKPLDAYSLNLWTHQALERTYPGNS